MKNKKLLIISIMSIFILILGLKTITTYNKLNSYNQQIKSAKSNIDIKLQRRADLIPNIVETTKGYATHEKDIFTDIANARAKMTSAGNTKDKLDADKGLSSAISRLLVVTEQYPQLQANENFKALIVELEGTENRITISRQDYNKIVTDYNSYITSFPTNIINKFLNFKEAQYFQSDEQSKQVPKVKF